MKNTTKKLLKAGLVLCIAVLFVGSSASAMIHTPGKLISAPSKATAPLAQPAREEVELKYYIEENIDQAIGVEGGGGPPWVWKTAIRLTQDEMASYSDWTLTKVNVGFDAGNGQDEMDVRIYIYDKGTSPTRPGSVICSDTYAHLDIAGMTVVPLNTTVPLADHEEIWIAVQWNQVVEGAFVALIDTVTGPHVENKSDFCNLGGGWQQLHEDLPEVDGRWAIGGIIEGVGGIAELSVDNVKGPIGIKADVKNIGEKDASNLVWSITVTGGILKKVNASDNGTAAALVAGATEPASVGMFLGFGKISIVITAEAQNAAKVSVTKSAFLLGPLVIGIK